MATLILKEIAFVKLASEYLGYTNQETKTLLKLAEGGVEMSPRLWEMIIEKVANIKFLNESGYDFADFTEAKTGSMTIRHDSYSGYCKRGGRITNADGKIGHMRVAIWNECTNDIDFFLIPPDHCCTSYSSAKNPQGAIQFSYSSKHDSYANNLEMYRVNSVEEVCKKVCNKKYKKAA